MPLDMIFRLATIVALIALATAAPALAQDSVGATEAEPSKAAEPGGGPPGPSATVDPPPALAGDPSSEAAARPSPAALRALCDEAFDGLIRQDNTTPAAIIAVDPDDPLAIFVVDYLHWCLGEAKGLALVERARIDQLIAELETQRFLGGGDITSKVVDLAGGESLLMVGVHPVDPQTRDLTLRATRVEGGNVLFASAPVRVESSDLLELQRDFVTQNNRLIAASLSAIIPGAGQVYNDELFKASLFATAEVALAGMAVFYHFRGKSREDTYSAPDAGADVVGLADKAEADYRMRQNLLIALGAVWAVSIIDAAVSGGVPAQVDQQYRDRIGVGVGPAEVGAWWRVPF